MAAEEKAGTAQTNMEEVATIRRHIDALMSAAEFKAAGKLIEENLATLYEKERWPDSFFGILRKYQKCYAMMDKSASLEEHLTQLLEKRDIPTAFVLLLRISDNTIQWTSDYFKNLALTAQRYGDDKTALSYADLLMKLDPNNANSCVFRGWILDDLDRPRDAQEMYKQALELSETNHAAHNALAKHLAKTDNKAAMEHIMRAIELEPTQGSYYDTKARILNIAGDKDAAIFCYDLAISAEPLVADHLYNKGELLLQMKKDIAALGQYKKALSVDSEHVPTLWRLVKLYQETQPEMALAYINTLLTKLGDDTDAKLLRGALLSKLGKDDDAESQFQEVIAHDNTRHEALSGYAKALLLKDPEKALEYYDRAITIAPKIAEYHYGRARALELIGEDAGAIKAYRKAIALDNKNARAYAKLAALLAEKKPAEAIECYAKAIGIMPDNAFYYASKAELLLAQPNGKAEAIACYDAACQYDPNNARLHAVLADLLIEAGNDTSAVEHLKTAVALEKTKARPFFQLAKLLLTTEPEMALLHINSAINLERDNGEFYYIKSKVLTELGHNKQALEQLMSALRTNNASAETLSEISELLGADSPRLALFTINKAIEFAPQNADFLATKADILFDAGETQKAQAMFEEVIRLDSKSQAAMFGIGKCVAETEPDAAIVWFDKAIAIDKKQPDYYAKKAELLAKKGLDDDAIKAYADAIGLDSDNVDYLLPLARLYDGLGKDTQACEIYKKVLQIRPQHAESVCRMGVLLAKTNPAEALIYLDNAIDFYPADYIFHAWKGYCLLQTGHTDIAAAEYQTASRLGGDSAESYYQLATLAEEKMPETALGFALRAIEADDTVADYHITCGKIYRQLNQQMQAAEQFSKAISIDITLHEPRELIASMLFERESDAAVEAIDKALVTNPSCAQCLLMKAKALAMQEDMPSETLIAAIEDALKARKDFVEAQEMLVEVLSKTRSPIRLMLEKRKLAKMKG